VKYAYRSKCFIENSFINPSVISRYLSKSDRHYHPHTHISSLQVAAKENRIKIPRRSTVTAIELSELQRVSSTMKQEMSKLQQSNKDGEETDDVASSSITSIDTVQEKR